MVVSASGMCNPGASILVVCSQQSPQSLTTHVGSSYSKLLAFEVARILHRLGCDVRVYNPAGLPMKDDVQHDHEKVRELRDLSRWSDGHFWVSPEQHGNLVSISIRCTEGLC